MTCVAGQWTIHRPFSGMCTKQVTVMSLTEQKALDMTTPMEPHLNKVNFSSTSCFTSCMGKGHHVNALSIANDRVNVNFSLKVTFWMWMSGM